MSVTVSLVRIEGQNLRHLVSEFLTLLSATAEGEDEALSRLAPPAYPDDAAASAEFRRGTRDALFDRRRQDAAIMLDDLDEFDGEGDEEPGDDPLRPHALVVPAAHLDPWMRTLAGLRLVVASRLGIDTDDRHDPDDQRFHVYDWLGYRLEDLIRLADELDSSA